MNHEAPDGPTVSSALVGQPILVEVHEDGGVEISMEDPGADFEWEDLRVLFEVLANINPKKVGTDE